MFTTPDYVFKDGELVVRNGKVVKVVKGSTHTVKPEFDRSIENDLKQYFAKYHTMSMENFKVNENEVIDSGGKIIVQEAKGRREKTE
jgi:formylmethanofuran dehydrogenase subunit A